MSRSPFAHLVIRASAGSGKTYRLTNRYLALLAAGVEPNDILATTFTRKAAGEILDRVLARLAKAAGDDNESTELAKAIDRASFDRKEFGRLLRDLLHGLHRVRIGTLDSFYITLARSFNLELGLPAGWEICEKADDAVLREEAIEQLLEQGEGDALIQLYGRLTCGDTKRGVQRLLLDTVKELYGLRQETEQRAWHKIAVPPELPSDELEELFARMEGFDLSKNSRMAKARDADIESARSEQWSKLIKQGLAAKVITEENKYYNKPIPDELIDLYLRLIDQAKSTLVGGLAEQTIATRELLDQFHDEFWTLKQSTGGLRFDEVTRAVGAALRREALKADSLAFRLDGGIEHLLLDEFQDTSLIQWRVLEPIAQAITRAKLEGRRSFFCVGDVKQAIFGWRGGMSEILGMLQNSLGPLEEESLAESRRSARPIIDVINEVFGKLEQLASDKCAEAFRAWSSRFEAHTTAKTDAPGYVYLGSGPAQKEEESTVDIRSRHLRHVAEKIRDLARKIPQRTIGVLCRKNDTISGIIYELRDLGVHASQEGGRPLTDSPAVELMLSLFTLADHPGHSIAWFHLGNSPLKDEIESFETPEKFSRQLRNDILVQGYGPFTLAWAEKLAPICDRQDRNRLEQLVETAYGYQARSNLRADAFVHWVREKDVADPSEAKVRVLTIHKAKGLQFDAVFLPELDVSLRGQVPPFVVDRDSESLEVTFVSRYADRTLQAMLTDEDRAAFEKYWQRETEESLSNLYVAMTRAAHALYMYIPGPRNKEVQDNWHNLLQLALAPDREREEFKLLAERGDANWHSAPAGEPAAPMPEQPSQHPRISFRSSPTERPRGLERAAPSRREGGAKVDLKHLFHPSEGTGMPAGTLYHAWFAAIDWLDDGPPAKEKLVAAAEKIRTDLPADSWNKLDEMLEQFFSWLEIPAIRAVFLRSAYVGPKQAGFPATLAPVWKDGLGPQKAEQERRFLVRRDNKFWNGSFDRVVWLADKNGVCAADILDFKTDRIMPGNEQGLADRVAHYRPQLEVYRDAVSLMAKLDGKCISTRLVFPFAECVKDV
jgi:ATP-dependent exoDNAse (exonuclease V) beta subunit